MSYEWVSGEPLSPLPFAPWQAVMPHTERYQSISSKDHVVTRLRSLAQAVRLWHPHIAAAAAGHCGDLLFSREYMNEIVDWLDVYTDEMECPQSQIVVRSRGRWGFDTKLWR